VFKNNGSSFSFRQQSANFESGFSTFVADSIDFRSFSSKLASKRVSKYTPTNTKGTAIIVTRVSFQEYIKLTTIPKKKKKINA